MEIKFNKNFEKLITGYLENFIEPLICQEFLNFDIILVDDCYYFSFLAPEGLFSKDLIDKTGNEVSYNKILIEDYLTVELDGFEQFFQSIHMVSLLKTKLEMLNDNFRIILNLSDFTYLTFHKIRNDENYLDEDLESYSIDSILIFDIIGGEMFQI